MRAAPVTLTRRGFSAALAGTATLATVARAAGLEFPGADVMTEQLDRLREEHAIPAVAAAVMRGGTLVWSCARGWADIELEVAAKPDNLFRIGSVSKVVTAAIGARLAERGVVDLDAPIGRYRPSLPAQHHATTLRQLFSHRGGIRHYLAKDYDFAGPGGAIDTRFYRSTEEALALFIDDPFVAPPGTTPNYSTFGYTLIAAVLESASGKPFLALLEDEVVAPLSLREFAAERPLGIVPGRVRPYDPRSAYEAVLPVPDTPVLNALPVNLTYKWAGGGLLSSARSLAEFGAAHLAGGFLKDETREMIFRPVTEATPRMPPLGLGWRVDRVPALGARFHHAGNVPGCRAQLALYPERDLTVALLSNLGGIPGNIADYADRLAASSLA